MQSNKKSKKYHAHSDMPSITCMATLFNNHPYISSSSATAYIKLQESTLYNIESKCNGDVEKCNERLLVFWLEGYVGQVPNYTENTHRGYKQMLVWENCMADKNIC